LYVDQFQTIAIAIIIATIARTLHGHFKSSAVGPQTYLFVGKILVPRLVFRLSFSNAA